MQGSRDIRGQQAWRNGDGGTHVAGSNGASHHSRFETLCTSSSPPPTPSLSQKLRSCWSHFGSRLRRLDPVKLAYLRTSFVFAISVLITWTPSSINRVYSLIYPTRVSVGLNMASAVVLPLQGVWNAVIYFSTSWSTLSHEVKQMRSRRGVRRLASREFGRRVGGIARNGARHGGDSTDYAGFGTNNIAMPLCSPSKDVELQRAIGGNVRAMQGSF